MPQVPAFMNNGRWLLYCPKDGEALPAWDAGVICPRCHPGILAKAFQLVKGGLFRPVTDLELVNQARQEAAEQDEIYVPAYPEEKVQIEKILRLRSNRENMNWIASETLEDLRQQNIEHGDPVPEE